MHTGLHLICTGRNQRLCIMQVPQYEHVWRRHLDTGLKYCLKLKFTRPCIWVSFTKKEICPDSCPFNLETCCDQTRRAALVLKLFLRDLAHRPRGSSVWWVGCSTKGGNALLVAMWTRKHSERRTQTFFCVDAKCASQAVHTDYLDQWWYIFWDS